MGYETKRTFLVGPLNHIVDLHVGHVGGEVQKNILSILLWHQPARRKTLSGLSQEIACCKSRIANLCGVMNFCFEFPCFLPALSRV